MNRFSKLPTSVIVAWRNRSYVPPLPSSGFIATREMLVVSVQSTQCRPVRGSKLQTFGASSPSQSEGGRMAVLAELTAKNRDIKKTSFSSDLDE